ncbi:MAG TPA: TIGR01777 family oxidoreductase [Solirubrobacteraceae bacterium]|nr:TIGR01777 family oxidoreductase [Solirubrobacteraceae bacterium]
MSERVTVTGATGLIGPRVVAALQDRGMQVSVLSRDPQRARERLQREGHEPVDAYAWDLMSEPAPAQALEGRDGVVHLAGENLAQRWSARAKQAIRESRVTGTRNLLAGIGGLRQAPKALVSSSGVGYYGPRGEEPLDEEATPGRDFLAEICVEWEAEAQRAQALGVRVVCVRTGVVLDKDGGALEKMLPPFKLGVGGPVAGGRQYISWVHTEDVVGMMVTALSDERWSGAVNATAPTPVNNRDFARALGRALKRPALLPVPGVALQLLYGEMAELVTEGARVVPAKPLVLGYEFAHPELDEALSSALQRG